jgi:hypothetical protein
LWHFGSQKVATEKSPIGYTANDIAKSQKVNSGLKTVYAKNAVLLTPCSHGLAIAPLEKDK